MSKNVVKEFLVSLGLDVVGAVDFENSIGKATLLVAGLGTAVEGAAVGIFAFATKVAGELDAIGDAAGRANTTSEAIQEMGYVAQLTGGSFEAATSSIEGLNKAVGDAFMGMGEGKKVFESIGVSVKDANGKLKNSADLMWEVGDAIKDMEKGQQIAVLQRLGIDKTMVDALTTSVGGLRDEFKEVYAAVGFNANEAAEKSGKFMDSLDKLGFVLTAVGRALATQFMSKFTESIDRLRKLIMENLPKIMAVLKPIMAFVLALADVFIALAARAIQGISVLIDWIVDIVSAMNGWVVGILAVAAAWRFLNLGFLASPVGIIIALATALGLLIDDFMTWKEGGDSLIDWDQWSNEIQLVTDILGVLRTVLENMFTYLFATVDAIIKLFSGDFSGAFIAVQIAVESLANILETVFGLPLGTIKEQFASAFKWINGIIDGVIGKLRGFLDMASNAAGVVGDFIGIGGDAPLAPGPSVTAGAGNGQQNITQETNITIQGGANPESTAAAVANQQGSVNGDMVRNMKGAVR